MSSAQDSSSREFGLFRLLALAVWATLVAFAIGYYTVNAERFSPELIAAHLREFETAALCIYLALSIFRGLSLLPSTPLVLAGTLLFPHQPWLVLGISLLGIIASSGMIYWLADALGIAAYLERKKPHQIGHIRARLEHPAGLLFVGLWSFFPLVPTDAVCYVAGTIRMNFPKFILAIFLGELILCSIYVFGGLSLMEILF